MVNQHAFYQYYRMMMNILHPGWFRYVLALVFVIILMHALVYVFVWVTIEWPAAEACNMC